jgi:hypothetical protein
VLAPSSYGTFNLFVLMLAAAALVPESAGVTQIGINLVLISFGVKVHHKDSMARSKLLA